MANNTFFLGSKWLYHPLTITSDFSFYPESSHVSHVIPNALVTSRAIYNCTGRRMELCVPGGLPRIAETNSYPEVDQLSMDFRWVRITLNAKSSKRIYSKK